MSLMKRDFGCLGVIGWVFGLLSVLWGVQVAAGTVYQYKDASGHWQFSDKPPKDQNTPTQTLAFAAEPENPLALKFDYRKQKDKKTNAPVRSAYVVNPFYIPVQVKIQFDNNALPEVEAIVPSNGRFKFYEGAQRVPKFKYRYVWGEPGKGHSYSAYQLPVSSLSQHIISQGFNGRFSHTKQPNVHAVDIALPIGTDIVAARAGTVVFVRDDYAFGGAQTFFLDKANAVYVLHEDGTYAVYAHLLMGSAVVKAGQRVNEGDILAQSGTSGYSTGPHLHFVIRKNVGFRSESVPFRFSAAQGLFTPQRKQKICPCPSLK